MTSPGPARSGSRETQRRNHAIALLGLFGGGNFGNDASLDAALAAIGSRNVEPIIVCELPHAAAARWSVRAISLQHAGAAERLIPAGKIGRAVARIPIEVARTIAIYRFIRRVDAIVVPGTGILDDFGMSPRQMPFDLARWSVLTRIARRPMHFVAVGAGPVTHPLSRWLFRVAVAASASCSYRDTGSLTFMRSIGRDTSRDPVVPDLVFSFGSSATSTPPTPGRIALGVMGYYGWANDPASGQSVHREYVDRVVRLATELIERGDVVRLVIGDTVDLPTASEVEGEVRSRLGMADGDTRISTSAAEHVKDVVAEMAAAELVIATRYHNIIAAVLAHRPVISLAYATKNDAVLAEVGLARFTHSVDTFDVEEVLTERAEISAHYDELADSVSVNAERLHQRSVDSMAVIFSDASSSTAQR